MIETAVEKDLTLSGNRTHDVAIASLTMEPLSQPCKKQNKNQTRVVRLPVRRGFIDALWWCLGMRCSQCTEQTKF